MENLQLAKIANQVRKDIDTFISSMQNQVIRVDLFQQQIC